MHENTALLLTKELLHAQLVLRDWRAALRPLAEDICWFGTGEGEEVQTLEQAASYFQRELSVSPTAYTLEYLEESCRLLCPEVSTCTVKMQVTAAGLCLPCRVTATACLRNGEPKLCTLHMSVPDDAQQSGEFFPFSLAQSHEKAMYQEFLTHAVNGGIIGGYLEPGWPLYIVNRQLLDFLGYASEAQLREDLHGLVRNGIHPDDRGMVEKEVTRQLAQDGAYQVSYRMFRRDKSSLWVEDRGKLVTTEDGRQAIISICYDITHRREAELALRLEQEKTSIALENSDIFIWEYDIVHHRTIQQKQSIELFASPPVTEHMPETAVNRGLVHPDSIAAYVAMYRAVEEGAPSAQAEVRLYDVSGAAKWYRLTFKTLFDAVGQPVRAIGCGVDITAMKTLQYRYQAEVDYLSAAQGANLLGKCRANLTQNLIDNYKSTDAMQISIKSEVYSSFSAAIGAMCINQREATRIAQALAPASLLRLYASGQTSQVLEYQRKLPSGEIRWVSTHIKLAPNPENADVMCFMYTYDIDRQKTGEAALNALVQGNYDFVGVANCISGSFTCISRGEHPFLPGPFYDVYSHAIRSFAENLKDYFGDEDDYLLMRDGTTFDVLQSQLSTQKEYAFHFKLWDQNRAVLHTYQMHYCYIDPQQTQILVCRIDITDSVAEEQRRQDLLVSALHQAEQASHAKTDFLSKMSHEIRTPMNAIIGMNALAAQNISDPEQAGDCIAKVGISARYLLSLINDILDMSRIESGKVNIRREPIPFQEFLSSVNTICYEQAIEQGITYDAILTGFIEDIYLGDSMKLQQILVNLLSNAVKFTPAGGKVQLIVSQDQVTDGKAQMRFTVNDTGVGISEEFQKVMFDPFEQEHSGITTPYGGTGLGLAITKNLVNLMGGRITVNSILGVGTEFTVTLPLEISEDAAANRHPCTGMPLEKLSALVVDDEVLICQQTKSILSDMGMKAEWVDSGRKAVELVQRHWAEKRSFDIILIDWKMPDMDGIETARCIRKIVGPEVTIIIITAYEWVEIEKEAKAAGVNLLVAKPLFKSSLISAFEKIYVEKELEAIPVQPVHYDFTGRRVLLVEDHLLNVEVARRLLEAKGMAVEVAENGLAAIEAFVSAPDDYFDLILMDIRMPVMDGLTAARTIRQMKKSRANTIPILAMSANAFDEDVEKSKNAGMNAHLSKPIEPQALYAAIGGVLED